METSISSYPNSYLTAKLDIGERILVERGALVMTDGDYELKTKFEMSAFRNWIGRIFGGKKMVYNIYKAKEPISMIFSPDANGEIFGIDISESRSVVVEPYAHFARTDEIELKIISQDWKTTFNDGLKMRASGNGKLFLIGYGKILHQRLDPNKEYIIDEDYLLAYESHLEIKTISRGFSEFMRSGEGYLYSVKGDGEIWTQTRDKTDMSGGGGLIGNILGIFR